MKFAKVHPSPCWPRTCKSRRQAGKRSGLNECVGRFERGPSQSTNRQSFFNPLTTSASLNGSFQGRLEKPLLEPHEPGHVAPGHGCSSACPAWHGPEPNVFFPGLAAICETRRDLPRDGIGIQRPSRRNGTPGAQIARFWPKGRHRLQSRIGDSVPPRRAAGPGNRLSRPQLRRFRSSRTRPDRQEEVQSWRPRTVGKTWAPRRSQAGGRSASGIARPFFVPEKPVLVIVEDVKFPPRSRCR